MVRYAQGDFALRGEFLSQRWERNQRIAGGRLQRSTVPVLLVALPPDPIYGGYPFGLAENFRRAKSEWRSAVSPGPLGPGFAKIRTGAVPPPRLSLPNQRYQRVSAVGATLAAARQAFPLVGGRWLAEGQTDEGDLLACTPSGGRPLGLPPRLPPLRGKLSAARLTDEGAYRISVFFFMDSPSSASHSLGTFPLGGGRLYGRLIAAPTAETHRER